MPATSAPLGMQTDAASLSLLANQVRGSKLFVRFLMTESVAVGAHASSEWKPQRAVRTADAGGEFNSN